MMKKQVWTMLYVTLLFITTAFSQKTEVLTAEEFSSQIKQPDIQLLDVRTAEEYRTGHIVHSLQADWLKDKEFKRRVKYLDKEKPLYVYCGSGVRSNDAAKWLRKNGFGTVFELQNGILGWKKASQPLEAENILKQLTLEQYKSLTNKGEIVLIDFGAKWCPPCKKMEPVLDQLQAKLPGEFVLEKIDAGIHTDIMQQLNVDELPTFIIYKNGKEVWRKIGLVSFEEFDTQLQQHKK